MGTLEGKSTGSKRLIPSFEPGATCVGACVLAKKLGQVIEHLLTR